MYYLLLFNASSIININRFLPTILFLKLSEVILTVSEYVKGGMLNDFSDPISVSSDKNYNPN